MKETSRAGGRQEMPLPLLIVVTVLLLGAGLFLGIRLLTMGILPTLVLAVYWAVLAVLVALLWVLRKNTGGDIAVIIIALLFAIFSVVGGYVLGQVHSAVDDVTHVDDQEHQVVSVVVLEDSPTQAITDLTGATVGYAQDNSLTDSIGAVSGLREAVNGEVTLMQFNDILSAVDALLRGEIDALLVNESYLEIIEGVEGYEDFATLTRVLYAIEIVMPEKLPAANPQQSDVSSEVSSGVSGEISSSTVLPERTLISGNGEDTFIAYISGIDTYGKITTRSRSDVNILAIVNTNTKEIQLINTPRDYYIPLANSHGVLDKLTHAGIYGINNSVGTLEQLYGIQIDYYVRLNFSGFEDIIDTLGGVDVNSDYDFTVGSTHFNKGMNHLNGKEALTFARERHSFKDGDSQRGRNQMAVISGVINKLTSTDILYHYAEVLEELSGCFQTNMGSDQIYALVRRQLESMDSGWSLSTYTVGGEGARRSTYSMPHSSLWVMIPDYSTVEVAKEKMVAILNAE